MSSTNGIPKASRETIQAVHSVSKTLGLTFNADQIEALISVFELGADPDAVMRFLSENQKSNILPYPASTQAFTPSTSVPRRSNVSLGERSHQSKDKQHERFGPN